MIDDFNERAPVEADGTVDFSLINRFAETIPRIDRAQTIMRASKEREQFMMRIWGEERIKLPAEMVKKYNLTEDMTGWDRYLQAVYSLESDRQRERYGLGEWSVKYLSEMLSTLEDDASTISQTSDLSLAKVDGSYYKYYSETFGTFGSTIGRAVHKPIEPDSLFVHSVSAQSLGKIIQSGVVGRGGLASCAMSQDRVIYDDGYIIVFQAKDLVAAGYPLLQVNEDGRDAHILREWRTPMPIDVSLARLIVPTDNIPDRANCAQAEIADSFFGEKYLRQVPRI